MQQMMVGLRTQFNRDKLVSWRAGLGFATCYQVWSRSAYGILEDIGQEGGCDDRDRKAEQRHMRFVQVGTNDEVPDEEQYGWYGGCIYEQHDCIAPVSIRCFVRLDVCSLPTDWHPLHLGMRMLYPCIAQSEHLMKGLGRELDDRVCREEHCESQVVAGIALLPEPLRRLQEATLLTEQLGFVAFIVTLGAGHDEGGGRW